MSEVVRRLLSTPMGLPEVIAQPSDGGAPAEPGLHAWWVAPGAVPGIAGPPHPDCGLELLYVGIARNRPASKSTLRSRLVRNHIRGTTGQSTLRRALAALLSEHEGWRSRWTTRPVLVRLDDDRLSVWMHDNLRVTWAVHPEPWTVEHATVEELRPPLNQVDNRTHPLYDYVKEMRTTWREAARRLQEGD
ncbi:MAG: hypothetical protein JWQ45_439 [Blastococcus sp.]|nr:hypothetical protein [Blastococcus sp.]